VSTVPEHLRALVDDAAVFPPGNAPLDEAVRANRTLWKRGPHAPLVGTFVIDDVRLADLDATVRTAAAEGVPDLDDPFLVSVVVSGGAGALEPAVRWSETGVLRLAGLEVAVRDSATGEATHNARRIVTAVDRLVSSGDLDEAVPVHVEMPRLYGSPPTPDWFGALDELGSAGLRLKLRTGGLDADAFPAPHELAGCIEAALDREMPFKCTAGLHRAVRHDDPATGFAHHGFLNVLLATKAVLDGASVDDAARVLDDQDADPLAARATPDVLASARRWFTSFGSCSVVEPLEDLQRLGLLS
jgi:hypothetical protein